MNDDTQLIRYLLGLLPEQEAELLDEQSIADDEMAARMRSAENDLVDAYVSGTLQGEFLERFESFYLASPRRREKVKFARQLLTAVDRLPTAEPARSQTAAPRRRLVSVCLASAAMLFLACGVLLLQDVRLQRGLVDARHDGAVLDSRARELDRQLGEQRTANDTMRQELDRVRATPPIALVLRPQTRAAATVAVIVVPPGVEAVSFELELEAGAGDFAHYQVSLKDPATNRIVWRSGVVTRATSRRPPTVAVAVPSTFLKPQHYSLELSGRRPGAAFDVVGSYAFQMAAR